MCEITKFGERLSELMFYEDEISSSELAELIGVTVQTVNRWKRGEQLMNLSNLIKVANVLKCTVDYLIGRNDSALDFVPQECPMFYNRLRDVMKEKHITWYKLTKETNIKSSYLYIWKNGADTKISALIELADYFDISIDYLIGRDR